MRVADDEPEISPTEEQMQGFEDRHGDGDGGGAGRVVPWKKQAVRDLKVSRHRDT